MAPAKWTEKAERDLLLAILWSKAGKQPSEIGKGVAWSDVEDKMRAWGYETATSGGLRLVPFLSLHYQRASFTKMVMDVDNSPYTALLHKVNTPIPLMIVTTDSHQRDSQRWGKHIVKIFDSAATGTGAAGSSSSNAAQSTPLKRKTKAAAVQSEDGEDVEDEATPAKKPRKTAPKKLAKQPATAAEEELELDGEGEI
ncbi:uncharacterized protein JN550_001818 [Neoarthrinium moseri]|uniref:uncharacterized protein n=1 Tax=Neoarthrinium moseri TaxID=1658444 RepID=UPI001FDB2A73|nr:uncharacterized protein JN550_001818 [Neoarthrinium moseri]KAI1875532.1 hypothetical protein JN550_001818 [Neoarthrinium moseri]